MKLWAPVLILRLQQFWPVLNSVLG